MASDKVLRSMVSDCFARGKKRQLLQVSDNLYDVSREILHRISQHPLSLPLPP